MIEYLKREVPIVPDEIKYILDNEHEVILSELADVNNILIDSKLQQEIGYSQFEDGSYLVSMICPMPNITIDMVNWWFWWHPQEDIRYQAWFPGSHHAISYHNKNKQYFNRKTVPEFKPNTHFPVESVSNKSQKIRIDFVYPRDMGFDENLFEANNIAGIVCGHVSAVKGLIKHTEMAHIFKQTDEGLFLISRFWLGKTFKNKFIKSKIINEEFAYDMAVHCCREYRNFAKIVPELYSKYSAN